MQHLKRKNAVRIQSNSRHAPHELTPDGREMLAAMKRQAQLTAAE
jgi:predicted transcriptional regulator